MSEFASRREEFPRLEEQEPLKQRGKVVRMAIMYTLFTSVCAAATGVAIYKLVGGDGGFVVMLVLFGLFGLLFGYWARHYLRDISAAPIYYEGELLKKWHKGNLFILFMPSFYIYVTEPNFMKLEDEGEKPWAKVFTIGRREYAMLLETDRVRVRCYPHSLSVEDVERYDETEKKFVPATYGATD